VKSEVTARIIDYARNYTVISFDRGIEPALASAMPRLNACRLEIIDDGTP